MATLRITCSTGASVELEDFDLISPDATDTHLAQMRAALFAVITHEFELFGPYIVDTEDAEPGPIPEA